VNSVPVFEWVFKRGHFTFLPITAGEGGKSWLLNSPIGFDAILTSTDLSDDLKRLLLPFYISDASRKASLSDPQRQKIKDYAYEFLFGKPQGGNEQILQALDFALSLNSDTPFLKDLARSLIRKSFMIADAAGDLMLVAFLFKHKDIFTGTDLNNFGERIPQLYQKITGQLKTDSIQKNTQKAMDLLKAFLVNPLLPPLFFMPSRVGQKSCYLLNGGATGQSFILRPAIGIYLW